MCKKLIRIAVVMGKYTPGGIKSVIMNYYRKINREKVQFDFFIYEDSPDSNYDEILSLGGRVYKISNIKNPIFYVYDLSKKLRAGDYVIIHGYLNTLNVFPMLAGFLSGIPVRIAENLSTAHKSEKKTFFKKLLKPFARCFSTDIAANSIYSAKWLYSKDYTKCFIIRNALDLNKYFYDEKVRQSERNKLGIEKKFVVGHIGRFAYQKNHIFLIDIFCEILKIRHNAVLLLIGYGELFSEIKERVFKYGIQSNVIFVGKTEDLFPLYNAMDCFVLPSLYEGLPVVGIEAQAFGLPCFFSSEITRETKILDSTVFIDLNETARKWAELIIEAQYSERKNETTLLTKYGYNLDEEVKRLERYYQDLIDNI